MTNYKPNIDGIIVDLKYIHSTISPCGRYTFRNHSVVTQSTDEGLETIKSYVSNINNGLIVEIGVMGGVVPLVISEICNNNNNTYIGIDPFEKGDNINGHYFSEIIDKYNLESEVESYKKFLFNNRVNLENIITFYDLGNLITIKQANSQDIVNTFNDLSIDLLHVDGSHDSDSVYQELKLYYPKIKIGGIILGDDYDWDPVKKGLDKYAEEFNIIYTVEGTKFKIIKQ